MSTKEELLEEAADLKTYSFVAVGLAVIFAVLAISSYSAEGWSFIGFIFSGLAFASSFVGGRRSGAASRLKRKAEAL